MQRGCVPWLFLLALIAIGSLSYFLGKKSASKTIDNMVLNVALVKDIAELSSLEVRGTATIKTSNVANDGSVSDGFKKLFLERTLTISVPYIAKYGIDLSAQHINVEEKNKKVFVVVPDPQLLSFELLLDRSDAVTRKGLLGTADETAYNAVQKKLYAESRKQLDGNGPYLNQSKEKIRAILKKYYEPMGFEVEVSFSDEIKSKVERVLD